MVENRPADDINEVKEEAYFKGSAIDASGAGGNRWRPGRPMEIDLNDIDTAVTGKHLLQVGCIFLLFKIIISSVIVFSYLSIPDQYNQWNRYYTLQNPKSIKIPFANWDGQHYLLLATKGYTQVQFESKRFFPLLPFTIKLTNLVVEDFYISGLLNITLFAFLFSIYLFKFFILFMKPDNALACVVLTFAYPSAFYLHVIYTEALFVFLLFGFLYYYLLHHNLCLIFAFLLPFSRSQGFFIPLIIFAILLVGLIRKRDIEITIHLKILLAFALGILGFLLFHKIVNGSFFAWMEAHKLGVFGTSIKNIFNPLHLIEYLVSPTSSYFAYNFGFFDKFFIVFSLIAFLLVLYTKNSLIIFSYFFLFYIPASMGNGGGYIRYSFLFFPFLAVAIHPFLGKRFLYYPLVISFIILQSFFAARFSANLWVG